MKVATGEQMRLLDEAAINEYAIPGIVLMENAGLRVIEAVNEFFAGDLADKRITIIVGKGNNGGDGLVIARHLHNRHAKVKLFFCARPEDFSGDAAANMAMVGKLGIPSYLIEEEEDLTRLIVTLLYTDLVVDAIFGTGFSGSPKGVIGKAISAVNKSSVPVLAVDIPSGLDGDTGKIRGDCVKADITVTFALPKLGLLVEPGASYVGRLIIADISIPHKLIEGASIKTKMVDDTWCSRHISARRATGHKGTYGHVVVVGGSRNMPGAPALAARAALKAGAGLVTAVVPRSIQHIVASYCSEIITVGLAEDNNGAFCAEATEELLSILSEAKAVVIGPGMSQSEGVAQMLAQTLSKVNKPVVLDADAINIISAMEHIQLPRGSILTPHPGEMARLMGASIGYVQSDRLAAVNTAVKKYDCVVVLKGARTLTATADGDVYVNVTGNPGMATAGSGDVLSGMIGALLAQGLKDEHAAAAAVFIHGLAGDKAAAVKGLMGLMAGDIIEQIPLSLHSFNR